MYTLADITKVLTEGMAEGEPTVDGLEPEASPDTEIRGIVTAFIASQHVIEQAATLGANLILTHEGAYFSHQDDREWLADDPVYLKKRELAEQSGVLLYRFHDRIHRVRPDGITKGLVSALGWESFVTDVQPAWSIAEIPPMPLREAAEHVKKSLGISYLRAAGDPEMECSRIGFLVGYRGGGRTAVPLFNKENVDLIIAGEGPEWETPEYVRDAVHQGRNKALIMLGHAESEAPGMRLLTDELTERFPGLPVHYVEDRPVFRVL